MNRYPLWKYAIIVVALLIGTIYTLPNFFGEAPAVQVSSGKVTVKVDSGMVGRVEQALKAAGIQADFVQFDGNSVKARFGDTDTQLKAKDVIGKAVNADPADPGYIVALNLLSRSPQWLTSLHAFPMYLGLDLRGGVHFLMQVDMKAALTKKAEALTGDVRSLLREKNIRHAGISRDGNNVVIAFRDAETMNAARGVLTDAVTDVLW
ncbi:MAG TPA: protein translocase subunit SecD, partial [Roseateles sp.]|nr:protein translocase subunit SecD [Roseateles sp.]